MGLMGSTEEDGDPGGHGGPHGGHGIGQGLRLPWETLWWPRDRMRPQVAPEGPVVAPAPQYDFYSWMPNAPGTMRCPPPRTKAGATAESFLATLPCPAATGALLALLSVVSYEAGERVSRGGSPLRPPGTPTVPKGPNLPQGTLTAPRDPKGPPWPQGTPSDLPIP